MRDFYLKEFNTESDVIAYGANIRFSKNAELIDQFHLKIDDYYLVVGRLIPDNNADLIVKEFVSSNSKKKLVIVGDVPYRDAYAEQIKKVDDDRVIFTGYVTDQNLLAELYHNCFCYLHGHEFGGTNPTMLKALAYGCAIIALDTPFTREMLDGEKHGLYFSKEENDLTTLLKEIDSNLNRINSLREHARDRIKENYTWDKIAKQYFDFFQHLV